MPQILLGDPAYPLLPYMINKFEHCKSNEAIFNQMLRSSRNQTECIFGFACFVLHIFCEREHVDVDKQVVEQVIQ